MDIIDPNFVKLSSSKKKFILLIGAGYFLVAVTAGVYALTNIVESLLILIVGLLFTEMLKLNYRVEALEKKKKK